MKKLFSSLFMLFSLFLSSITANAAVEITEVGGWFESGYVTWTKVTGYSYNVYYQANGASSWTKLDDALVREYPTYGRADVVGITAGTYKFKVVPVQDGAEVTADATETDAFVATVYDRGGFAHFKSACSTFDPANGVGAYKNDGTLKSGAKVIYVYADNAKTVTTDVVVNSKGKTETGVGFQAIIDLYQKGYDKTPLDFRIIGTIKADDMDAFGSSAEGLQIKGKSSYSEMNITIEGIGKDAAIHGFGFLIRNVASFELRNLAVMWAMDDAVSMDTDNSNLWIHNLDLFYGKPGSASDQKKGDGTLDIKGDSKYSTLSYNHLWDSGKSSLCGMTGESGPNYLTYHHNWFDHSDSRHPRIRTMSIHVYNNYFDGNSKYGVGASKSSNAYVENNYFRNCKYPMLISKQGSDVHNGVGSSDQTKGTFSGEAGGMIKAYGNYMTGQQSFEPYIAGDATYSTHFDAYVVANRTDQVPSTVSALNGGRIYDNFDTDASLMYSNYKLDDAADVKDIVTGSLGAGRCQHGDFTWTFGENEDNNSDVISALSTAIQNYKSTLVGFFGQTISNGGATDETTGNSNNGSSSGDSSNDGDDDNDTNNGYEEESYLTGETTGNEDMTSSDYFWFNSDNKEIADKLIANGIITLVDGKVENATATTYNPTYTNVSYNDDSSIKCQTVYTGSLQLAKASASKATDGGSVIFKCPKGVTTFSAYLYRTGSVYLNVYTSNDSVKWTKKASIEKGATGINTKTFTEVFDTLNCVYVKIENTSTGSLNLQGIRILNKQGATEKQPGTSNSGTEESGNTGSGDVDESAIYKFTVKEIVTSENTASDPITTQGGTFVYGSVEKIEASNISSTKYAYKLDGDMTATNSKYAKVTLNTPLKVGDIITLSGYCTSNPSSSNVYGFNIYKEAADGATALATIALSKKNVEEEHTITVDQTMAGLSTFYITRATKSTYLTGVKVTGSAAEALAGDANADGKVDLEDANVVVNYYISTTKEQNAFQGIDRTNADANGDGKITISDANYITNKSLEK